ncbi:MAG TPA: hypothetical protein VJJ22_01265 [Candidatus Paceibacterota bacterium]
MDPWVLFFDKASQRKGGEKMLPTAREIGEICKEVFPGSRVDFYNYGRDINLWIGPNAGLKSNKINGTLIYIHRRGMEHWWMRGYGLAYKDFRYMEAYTADEARCVLGKLRDRIVHNAQEVLRGCGARTS